MTGPTVPRFPLPSIFGGWWIPGVSGTFPTEAAALAWLQENPR